MPYPQDAYAELKRLLTQYENIGDEYDTPVPPPSPVRGPEPMVVGPASLGKQVREFTRMAPTLRDTVKEVRMGPVPGAELRNGLFYEPQLPTDGTLGLTTHPSRGPSTIAIAPNAGKDPNQQERVLSHELAHSAGWEHSTPGTWPQKLLDMLRGR